MGQGLIAKCSSCGYRSKELYYGRGWDNEIYNYPAVDFDTDEIEVANIYNKENVLKNNKNITFYDSDSLIDKKAIKKEDIDKHGKEDIFSGKVYYCPKCKEYQLEFYSSGLLWD